VVARASVGETCSGCAVRAITALLDGELGGGAAGGRFAGGGAEGGGSDACGAGVVESICIAVCSQEDIGMPSGPSGGVGASTGPRCRRESVGPLVGASLS